MNWKTQIQVLDLDPETRIELTCRKCWKVRFVTGAELQARKGAARLWLTEVEERARCRQRGCGGAMRLVLPRAGDTSGFVGGIA